MLGIASFIVTLSLKTLSIISIKTLSLNGLTVSETQHDDTQYWASYFHAECRSAVCRSAECRGAAFKNWLSNADKEREGTRDHFVERQSSSQIAEEIFSPFVQQTETLL